ncbi:class I SAM-dependent methyltransferase [Streptomyces sp. sk2.1]|uniref:class I SAM-dependent methyltransferase n=1 Tax=Streptomyces sp. sk2.1 TaxID=2478959 RepID=UPI0011E7D0FE|nr:class I SAM-dependent methyltransferase [Streptomyces sp. sk2.1]
MTDDILDRARTLSGYDDVSRIRQAQDHAWVLGLVPGVPRTLLDLGCGTGALLEAALDRWPDTARAVGVDGSGHRVREAGVRLAGRAELLTGDLLGLPALDDRFDVAFMTSVLHWLHPDEERAFAWVAAHLAPGGAFVLTTHHPVTDPAGLGGEDVVAVDALRLLGAPAELSGVVPMGVRARPAPDVRALLERYFTIEETQERTVPVRGTPGTRPSTHAWSWACRMRLTSSYPDRVRARSSMSSVMSVCGPFTTGRRSAPRCARAPLTGRGCGRG